MRHEPLRYTWVKILETFLKSLSVFLAFLLHLQFYIKGVKMLKKKLKRYEIIIFIIFHMLCLNESFR